MVYPYFTKGEFWLWTVGAILSSLIFSEEMKSTHAIHDNFSYRIASIFQNWANRFLIQKLIILMIWTACGLTCMGASQRQPTQSPQLNHYAINNRLHQTCLSSENCTFEIPAPLCRPTSILKMWSRASALQDSFHTELSGFLRRL